MLHPVATLIVYSRFTSESLNSLLLFSPERTVDRVIFLSLASFISMRKKGARKKNDVRAVIVAKIYMSRFYQISLLMNDEI